MDKVMQGWKFSAMLSKVTKQVGVKAVQREWDDTTLDRLWGLKPVYVAVIRRPKLA